MENNKNFIIAIVVSLAFLFAWQFFYVRPQQLARMAEQRAIEAARQESAKASQPASSQPPTAPQVSATPPAAATVIKTREEALSGARVKIETPSLRGSIALKGGRIDDLVLRKYTETVDPSSPKVMLLSPSGTAAPFFVALTWLANDPAVPTPSDETVWRQEGTNSLSPSSPVVLVYDNGQGLLFRRKISIDDNFLFTIHDEVENHSGKPVTLNAFGQIARLTEPHTTGYTVMHEGLIGWVGQSLKELTYSSAIKNYDPATRRTTETFSSKGGWLGFTDQYWAAVFIPDPARTYSARFFGTPQKEFYTDFLDQALTVAPGERQQMTSRLFAGAKEVHLLNNYEDHDGIERLSKLVDWGWFPFLTRPMFALMDWLYKHVGNFGVAILLTTVIVKLIFFPLANKSYASMSKMKLLQPEMKKIQERFKDDRARQQQALMDLYRKEKVNPMAGCLPILLQIPVFFALYKVLLITIEMRHAPFFGWIRDLSAPDPTSIFNLFGLIPWTPPSFLMLGVLPLLMGLSMWVQMKLNPAPTDPIQAQVMGYLPIVFTFLLAQFPAGLVLYWTWNNLLSFGQQAVIMKRQGAEVDILQNLGIKKLNVRRQRLQQRLKSGNPRTRSPAE